MSTPTPTTPIPASSICQLPLDQLRLDGNTQLREALDTSVVQEYAALLKMGVVFPPVIAFFDAKNHWLADGFHRVAAYRAAGRQNISVEIRAGSQRDAILYAAGANAAHGLRRTNADKQRSVSALLNDPEWGRWSDREIARRTGVHHAMVGRIRAELSGGNLQTRVVERGGKLFEMKVPRREPDRSTQLATLPLPPSSPPTVVPSTHAPEGEHASYTKNVAAVPADLVRRIEAALKQTAPGRPVVRGEGWRCGPHRLYCRSAEDVVAASPDNVRLALWIPPAAANGPESGQDRRLKGLLRLPTSLTAAYSAVHPSPNIAAISLLVELLTRLTEQGDLVLAPWLGMGEILLVCEALGRTCIAGDPDGRRLGEVIGRWEDWSAGRGQLIPGARIGGDSRGR